VVLKSTTAARELKENSLLGRFRTSTTTSKCYKGEGVMRKRPERGCDQQERDQTNYFRRLVLRDLLILRMYFSYSPRMKWHGERDSNGQLHAGKGVFNPPSMKYYLLRVECGKEPAHQLAEGDRDQSRKQAAP
jgi:hypothetical protein